MKHNGKTVYMDFIERDDNILHAPYNPELEFYTMIQSGAVSRVKESCQTSPLLLKDGLGILSDSMLQNIKYHFVITTALVARYCIEGGMELSEAYSLSDFYIKKADICRSLHEVSNLHPIMCLDYTKRMKNLRNKKICSKHIARCLDYIYDHLHKRITVDDLSNHVGLTPEYLSRLFKKETGSTISGYIQNRKLDTACNMLKYSDYSPSQISNTLAFPSQSYFCDIFKKKTGMTPTEYRAQNFRSLLNKSSTKIQS